MPWLSLLARFWWVIPMLLLSASVAWYRHEANAMRTERDEIKAVYASFQMQVKTLGDAQNEKAKAQEASDKQRKGKADAENAKTHAALTTALNGLRASNDTSRRELPAAPAGSRSPQLLCLDRAEYQRTDGAAISGLLEGARRLADEGTAATIDLNTAKDWARKTNEAK